MSEICLWNDAKKVILDEDRVGDERFIAEGQFNFFGSVSEFAKTIYRLFRPFKHDQGVPHFQIQDQIDSHHLSFGL